MASVTKQTDAVPTLETERGSLDSAHLIADLRARTARGAAVALAAQLGKQGIQLASTMVMARILLPADYGLVAMVTTVVGFVALAKDMGLSMATVQRERITHEQASMLFWVNALVGAVLAAIVVGVAPVLAWFYREPRLLLITLAVAPGLLLGAFGVQHQALLQRQMRFGSLAALDLVSLCIASAAGVAMALAGWGYWALVLNGLVSSLVTTAGLWALCPWRPGPPLIGEAVRPMLAFGGALTGFNLVNYLARNLDNVLIGRLYGEEQLGFYSKAYNLLILPLGLINSPIQAVAIPALSRLQCRPDQYRELYLRLVGFVALVTMPGAAFMMAESSDLIHLLLGTRWAEASSLFTILGISALVQPIYNTQGWIHISMGRTDRLLRWGIVGTTVIVASFMVGLPFGPRGIALVYSCTILVLVWPCLWYAFGVTRITLGDLLNATGPALVSSAVAGGLAKMVALHVAPQTLLSRLATGLCAMVGVYGLMLWLLPGGRVRARQARQLVRALVGGFWTK